LILAIDTATEQASTALVDGDRVLVELSWVAGGNHSRHLTVVLDTLFALAGAGPEALTSIAVASGPGSFNGLRVGVSVAKGLAMARHIPLVGVSTLDIIGVAASPWAAEVWAVLAAGRGEVYQAAFSGRGDTWRRTSEYRRLSLAAAADVYPSGTLLSGNGANLLADALAARDVDVPLVTGAFGVRRAAFLAELGARYFATGGSDQLDELQPLYLRRSSAEEKREATVRE
jgi:tRNA threonylcarbamoyladenosine biosynthesis protein TsaB